MAGRTAFSTSHCSFGARLARASRQKLARWPLLCQRPLSDSWKFTGTLEACALGVRWRARRGIGGVRSCKKSRWLQKRKRHGSDGAGNASPFVFLSKEFCRTSHSSTCNSQHNRAARMLSRKVFFCRRSEISSVPIAISFCERKRSDARRNA